MAKFPSNERKNEQAKLNMVITGICNEVTKLKNKSKFYVSKYDTEVESDTESCIFVEPKASASTKSGQPPKRPMPKTKAMVKEFFDEEEEHDMDSDSSSDEDDESQTGKVLEESETENVLEESDSDDDSN